MSNTAPIPIAITGATGRMGSRLVALAKQDPQLNVVSALTRQSTELSQQAEVLIDFTAPEHMRHWVAVCRKRHVAMIIGTTGLSADDHKLIDEAAREIAILQAPNTSLAMNVLFRVAGQVAKTLGSDYDIEIVEAHHRFKKDAPSGTARGLADAINRTTAREVPMHSLRIGDEVGKHTVYLAGIGERLELTHIATSRDTFALGALRAAKWIAAQKQGRYTMSDVLGLS